jgi:hypothetical protein
MFIFGGFVNAPNDFLPVREKYSRFFAEGEVNAPPPGWLPVVEFALSELAAKTTDTVIIKGFRVAPSGLHLLPIYLEGSDELKSFFNDLLAETEHFCPLCGQHQQQQGGE